MMAPATAPAAIMRICASPSCAARVAESAEYRFGAYSETVTERGSRRLYRLRPMAMIWRCRAKLQQQAGLPGRPSALHALLPPKPTCLTVSGRTLAVYPRLLQLPLFTPGQRYHGSDPLWLFRPRQLDHVPPAERMGEAIDDGCKIILDYPGAF